MLLEGLFLPLTTPFYADGSLYLRKLEHNVDRYSKTPIAGMLVLGTTGEAELLSDEETRQALQTAIDAASVEKVMVAGVSRDSVMGTLELAQFAASIGYDAVLVEAPRLIRDAQRRELLTYFQTVADRSPLPVVLGSGGDAEGRALSVEAIGVLARQPRVIGIVDRQPDAQRLAEIAEATSGIELEVVVTQVFAAVTGRMLAEKRHASDGPKLVSLESLSGGGTAVAEAPVRPAIKTRIRTADFQVVAAGSDRMLGALQAGATAVLPSFAACAPQACYEVWAAWKDGDARLAGEKQERVTIACKQVEPSAGGIKYACDLNGYYGGKPRLPLLPTTGEERGRIEQAMRGIRN